MNTKSTTTQTTDIALLVKWATKDAAAKNDWPGMPLTQMPLTMRDALHAAIAAGTLEIVERPAKVDPSRMAHYIVVANA